MRAGCAAFASVHLLDEFQIQKEKRDVYSILIAAEIGEQKEELKRTT